MFCWKLQVLYEASRQAINLQNDQYDMTVEAFDLFDMKLDQMAQEITGLRPVGGPLFGSECCCSWLKLQQNQPSKPRKRELNASRLEHPGCSWPRAGAQARNGWALASRPARCRTRPPQRPAWTSPCRTALCHGLAAIALSVEVLGCNSIALKWP